MREVKFRGKRVDNGKWVYGHFVKLPRDAGGFQEPPSLEQDCWISNQGVLDKRLEEVAPETVGQYTGLKDKDGMNEIYEGDICKGHREDEDVLYEILWMPHCAKYGAKVIKSRYVLSHGLSFPLQHYIKDETLECTFVRVGNIYENSELLKV